MGEVFKAKDTRLDRTVAVKVLPDHLASDEAFRERFDPPIELMNFRPAFTVGPGIMAQYDPSPEGDRFLAIISASEGNEVQIVLGWLDELERLAPRH